MDFLFILLVILTALGTGFALGWAAGKDAGVLEGSRKLADALDTWRSRRAEE